MHFILDNLLAALISALVILALVLINQKTQEDTVDATNQYAMKTQELQFIEVLKHDLHGIKKLYSAKESATDSTFRFRTKKWCVDAACTTKYAPFDTASVLVTYRRKKAETRDSTQFYQIQRLEGNTMAGSSMVTVTDWKIEAQTSASQVVDPTMLSAATQVYVRFEAAGAFVNDKVIQLSRWEATFNPPLLKEGVNSVYL